MPPVPADIFALSQTPASNSPPGTESPTSADDYMRFQASCDAVLRDGKGFAAAVSLASGATTDIGAVNSLFVEVSGTTTITSFGTTYKGPRFLRFTGILTLTHAAALNLPGSANITTAVGDTLVAIPNQAANGWNVYQYQRAYGSFQAPRADVASAATVDLSSVADDINITGTTTITAFTIPIGRRVRVRFNASLTLTNNASIVTQAGDNISTRAGDTCTLRATAANTVEVMSYVTAFANSGVNAKSRIWLVTANGVGSTNTAIRRFSTTVVSVGTDITYADSVTLGATFTINTPGVYAVTYNDQFNAANNLGISLNSTQLTTSVASINPADRLDITDTAGGNFNASAHITIFLSAGDVIRPHTAVSPTTGASATVPSFKIQRVT